MKLLVRIAVLALAAVGARSLYEKYGPRIQEARRTGNRLMDESVKPAVHDAAATIGDAAGRAASTLADASRDVAQEVQHTATGSGNGTGAGTGGVESTGPFGDPTSASQEQDHPLSPMAARELGIEITPRPGRSRSSTSATDDRRRPSRPNREQWGLPWTGRG